MTQDISIAKETVLDSGRFCFTCGTLASTFIFRETRGHLRREISEQLTLDEPFIPVRISIITVETISRSQPAPF